MSPQPGGPDVWGVLLAGGDGTRLQTLTKSIEGDTRPKQFCRILGDESLLAQTRRRISPLFHPGRVIAVVTKKHETFYAGELRDLAPAAVIAQPENRGTAAAIATAILMLRGLDPEAVVAAFPCDHHYRDEAAFLDVVGAGIEVARSRFDAIVLVGAQATYPETEYGWIEPVQTLTSNARFATATVRQFWEKPVLQAARDLQRRGCLWNTFVTIGRVSAFIDVLCRAAPNAMLALSAGILRNNLESSYRSIPFIDFSRDVLTSQPQNLLVIRDAVSGWTDLGNPTRVFDTLARERIAPGWLDSVCGVEMHVAS
jgi:mannose-1-phosphate guanylyltransferase